MTYPFLARYLPLRKGNTTRRFHTATPLVPQSVGEHQAQMIVLALLLWPQPSFSLLVWCAFHDLAETVIGDLPSPILRAVPALREAYQEAERHTEEALNIRQYTTSLSPSDQKRAKLLDALECTLYAVDQVALGARQEFGRIAQTAWGYVEDLLKKDPWLMPNEALKKELEQYVRGAVFPVYTCPRCGAPNIEDGGHVELCARCAGHDIGTIIRERVAREEARESRRAEPTLEQINARFMEGADMPDPHDAATAPMYRPKLSVNNLPAQVTRLSGISAPTPHWMSPDVRARLLGVLADENKFLLVVDDHRAGAVVFSAPLNEWEIVRG